MRLFSIFAAALLVSCSASGWKAVAAADGERQVREDLGDAAATFSNVQVVGDSTTGQVCGFVSEGNVSETPARFVFYIDRTAGPWIEGQRGRDKVSDARFDFAWQQDCIGEGWQRSY